MLPSGDLVWVHVQAEQAATSDGDAALSMLGWDSGLRRSPNLSGYRDSPRRFVAWLRPCARLSISTGLIR